MSGRFIITNNNLDISLTGSFVDMIRVGKKIIVKGASSEDFITHGNLTFRYIFHGDIEGVELIFMGKAFSSSSEVIIICN